MDDDEMMVDTDDEHGNEPPVYQLEQNEIEVNYEDVTWKEYISQSRHMLARHAFGHWVRNNIRSKGGEHNHQIVYHNLYGKNTKYGEAYLRKELGERAKSLDPLHRLIKKKIYLLWVNLPEHKKKWWDVRVANLNIRQAINKFSLLTIPSFLSDPFTVRKSISVDWQRVIVRIHNMLKEKSGSA